MSKLIAQVIDHQKNVLDALKKESLKLEKIAFLCQKALKKGKKVFFFGNGGSAADAQHLCAELVGRFQKKRKPLAGIALSVNTSTLTALGNDFGFEEVFSRQLAALAKKGDVAWGFSTSGNSPNVIKAFHQAKKLKLATVAFLGGKGGKITKMVDHPLIVASSQTPRIQETHIFAGHIICQLIEEAFLDK